MKKIPRISDAEWEIMSIFWEKNPLTATKVIDELHAKNRTWHPNTSRTLIARLVQKQALARERQGRAYVYFPLVQREECIKLASDAFLTRVFAGSINSMLTHFITQNGITKSQLMVLRSLLEPIDE